MLQKYLELLKNGLDAMTRLSIKDATFIDYITAVGYEFAIVLLGLLMLGLAAAVLFGPSLLITKVNKRINTKISDKAILIHKWWNISLVKHAKSSFSYEFKNHWEEIKFALSNLLDEEGFAELLDVMKSTCRKTTGG